MLKQVTTEQLQEVLDSGAKVFVKFWRNDCPPCKASAPVVEKLASENTDVVFCEINVEDHPEAADSAGIRGVPAFFVFTGKEIKGQQIGFRGAEALKQLLQAIKES